jgi:predicted AAA+ superfamily ATPase
VLRLLHDQFEGLRVLATGSSSLQLAGHAGEPLTGRQRVFVLHPISWAESRPTLTTRGQVVEHSLVFGCYPQVIGIEDPALKVAHLRRLAADYLLRDLLQLVELDRGRLLDLLRLLALQLGSEVSLSELATGTGLDTRTVARYLDLLEECFVIVQLRGFSRNLRKEIAKSRKVYFVDLGMRNAITQSFQPSAIRPDLGGLWENWLVMERMKRNSNAGIDARYHFWRTYDRQEIDLIEERADGLFAFELKVGASKGRIPRLWRETYPESQAAVVTPDDLDGFLGMPASAA